MFKTEFILETRSVFSSLSRECISVFEVMSVYPISRYQNAIPRAVPLHELKKVPECFTLVIHDSIGHLKTLCMSVLSLSGGIESEWKCCNSPLSVVKISAVVDTTFVDIYVDTKNITTCRYDIQHIDKRTMKKQNVNNHVRSCNELCKYF